MNTPPSFRRMTVGSQVIVVAEQFGPGYYVALEQNMWHVLFELIDLPWKLDSVCVLHVDDDMHFLVRGSSEALALVEDFLRNNETMIMRRLVEVGIERRKADQLFMSAVAWCTCPHTVTTADLLSGDQKPKRFETERADAASQLTASVRETWGQLKRRLPNTTAEDDWDVYLGEISKRIERELERRSPKAEAAIEASIKRDLRWQFVRLWTRETGKKIRKVPVFRVITAVDTILKWF